MKRSVFVILICLFQFYCGTAQERFKLNNGNNSQIDFKLINNLMVIPVQVNGVNMSFLLDTGASRTVVFNMRETNIFKNRSSEEVQLKGISGNGRITAYKAISNLVKIGNATNRRMDMYLVEDQELNFFPQLGVSIQGIIGKDFFQDFVFEINYDKQYIKIYKHKSFPKKRLKKYELSHLKILSGKPHFSVAIRGEDGIELDVNLLLDTGMSDALWLINDNKLRKPSKKFHDFLGRSITGNVFGDRAKLSELEINSFKFNNVISAFPDSTSTKIPNVRTEVRNGVIGGEILRRFNCLIDYHNGIFGLRKNGNFSSKFSYNVSGLELYYDEYDLIKEIKKALDPSSSERLIYQSRVGVTLRPTVKILNVRKGSPADKIGIQNNDVLLMINNDSVSEYDLGELIQKINDFEKGEKIRIRIERAGEKIDYEFYPKDIL